ncbi:MAG TPA: threonine/serine dehydratase [Opitutaceae bacterium]|nr:threonine/serine dehydratase [Opitutaceae bacterium]
MKTPSVLQFADIAAARRRLATGLRLTPCHIAPVLSDVAGMRIWLKRDDLQRTGSFKERGARNALLCLSPAERERGVVAASAGNHALGLAYHGTQLGVRVTVVVPASAPDVKISRCRALGAEVVVHGGNFDQAQAHAAILASVRGATVVHPFDDPRVIAGQGTLGLEMLDQAPDAEAIVVPVGGGGMLAGVALVVKSARPGVRVIGVEPAGAGAFLRAVQHHGPVATDVSPTLADGLAVSRVGDATFALAAPLVDDLVTVSESEIGGAIAALTRHNGTVAEGAGAAALAAVLSGKVKARSVVVPVSGRNIDPALHQRILTTSPELRSPVQRRAA